MPEIETASIRSDRAACGSSTSMFLHGYPGFAHHEQRFQDTEAALRTLAPDILVLQEVWSTPAQGNMAERLADSLGMNHVYARANGSRRLLGFEEGAAILSRFPIVAADRLVLGPRQPWWETRIAILATIRIGAENLTVVGAHLAYRDPKTTEAQVDNLLGRVPSSGLTVMAGDWNAESNSDAVRKVLAKGFWDVVPGAIDHVFLPNDLNAFGWTLEKASWTLRPQDMSQLIGKETEISDHPGLIIDIARPSS